MTPLNEADDLRLLSLLRDDSEAAFTEIYNRYWKSLFRTAHHILQDREAAQDIVQNIFVSLWQRRCEAAVNNLRAYLHQAARFAVFKYIRELKNDQQFYERLAEVTADIITDNPLLFKEQQELLRQLIGNLPEECREAFRLSREENMTYKQIAEMLGISEKTVEKRMSRSLSYIRSGLSAGVCIAVLNFWTRS
jgi:RNA polymerase sigma-70 factor (ECF subfamily)